MQIDLLRVMVKQNGFYYPSPIPVFLDDQWFHITGAGIASSFRALWNNGLAYQLQPEMRNYASGITEEGRKVVENFNKENKHA